MGDLSALRKSGEGCMLGEEGRVLARGGGEGCEGRGARGGGEGCEGRGARGGGEGY